MRTYRTWFHIAWRTPLGKFYFLCNYSISRIIFQFISLETFNIIWATKHPNSPKFIINWLINDMSNWTPFHSARSFLLWLGDCCNQNQARTEFFYAPIADCFFLSNIHTQSRTISFLFSLIRNLLLQAGFSFSKLCLFLELRLHLYLCKSAHASF